MPNTRETEKLTNIVCEAMEQEGRRCLRDVLTASIVLWI